MIQTPLTIGTSTYDWRAAAGITIDALSSGALVAIGYSGDLPKVAKYVAIGVLIVAAVLGKVLAAQGLPIIPTKPS